MTENKTKYYVNKDGEFLGGFCGVKAPKGSVEVECPEDGRQVFDIVNNAWLPVDELLIAQDRLAELDAILDDKQALLDEREVIRTKLKGTE